MASPTPHPTTPPLPPTWEDGPVLHAAARGQEQRQAGATVLAVAAAVVGLGVLAELRAYQNLAGRPVDGPRDWATSLFVTGLLLIALQGVALLLALEHAVALRGWRRAGLVAVWLVRLVETGVILAAIYWAEPTSHWWSLPQWGGVSWAEAGHTLLIAEAVVVLVALLAIWRSRSSAGTIDRAGTAPSREPVLPAADGPLADVPPDAAAGAGTGGLLAIGASGGGIRAAAFVLGGHEATQEQRQGLGIAGSDEPEVFAVSGGSYIAGAFALRRAFTRTGQPRPQPSPWATTYTRDSDEVQRLRRHTRYLFEPGSRLRDGIVTLLVGATVNLLLIGLTLRFLVWVSAQLAVMLELVDVQRQPTSTGLVAQGAVVAIDSHFSSHQTRVLLVPLACGAAVVALTLTGWVASYLFDRTAADDAEAHRWADRLLRWSALWRPVALIVALAWLLLVFLLPGATAGVARMAAANQPNSQVASWVTSLGLVDVDICRDALARHLDEAADQADVLARLDPGVRQTVTASACGTEIDVHRTYAPGSPGTEPQAAPGSPRALTEGERATLRQFLDRNPSGTRRQVVGIAALLGLVGGLLRRGTAASATAATGRFAAVRRRLVTWLPLTIVGLVAVYLSVAWDRGILTHVAGPDSANYVRLIVTTTVVGCFAAFLLDANVTSMHRYYRSSLASAFAVGVRDEADAGDTGDTSDPAAAGGGGSSSPARALPSDRVYSFSGLGVGPGRPRLAIVTTLNTQAPGEAPTLRRGLPVVFTPGQVRVTEDLAHPVGIDTAAYERFAGPGRVSVMATIGISGAAVSPLMGRFNEQMAPYRLLLALFNLRLGTWTRNPLHTPPTVDAVVDQQRPWWMGPGLLWLTEKPGLLQMVLEAVGSSSASRRWVYLSDGGHLDNTGMVECVRRNAGGSGRILVLDASNDPVDSWGAVGDAVAVVRADLGIDLRRATLLGPLPWARRYQGAGLDVLVVKAVRVEPAGPEHADDPWWDCLPPDVQAFTNRHPDFPRASTARQKFGDLEFEAYRQLGFVTATLAFQAAGWVPLPDAT